MPYIKQGGADGPPEPKGAIMTWRMAKKKMDTQGPDLKQRVNQMVGAMADPTAVLGADEKQQIADNLNQLFYGLTWANWMQGMPLGQAWYTAGQQVAAYIAAKDPKNPVTMYMGQIAAVARTRIARDAMLNPYRDELIGCPPDRRDEWGAIGTKLTVPALDNLNAILTTRADTPAATADKAVKGAPVTIPPQVMAVIDQYQRTRNTR